MINKYIPKKSLQIADETINVTLASSLMNNILVVIITQSPRQFFIVHLRLVLPDAPSSGHLVRIGQLEFPAVPCPRYESLARLVGQQFQKELP